MGHNSFRVNESTINVFKYQQHNRDHEKLIRHMGHDGPYVDPALDFFWGFTTLKYPIFSTAYVGSFGDMGQSGLYLAHAFTRRTLVTGFERLANE